MAAFEGDSYIGKTISEIVNRINPDLIIETGTFFGETTKFLTTLNRPVLGLEKDENFYNKTLNSVKDCKNVQILLGDSPAILNQNYEILKDKKIFAFLDAHWGGGFILERELEFFAQILVKPYLAIHDFYNPNHPEYSFDYHDNHPYNFEFYQPYFERIYHNNYQYYYNDLAEDQKVGIIYLEPKGV